MLKLENDINRLYESLHLDQEVKDLTGDSSIAKLYRIEQVLTGYNKALEDWSDFMDFLLLEGYLSDDDHVKALQEWQSQRG